MFYHQINSGPRKMIKSILLLDLLVIAVLLLLLPPQVTVSELSFCHVPAAAAASFLSCFPVLRHWHRARLTCQHFGCYMLNPLAKYLWITFRLCLLLLVQLVDQKSGMLSNFMICDFGSRWTKTSPMLKWIKILINQTLASPSSEPDSAS